MCIYTLLDKMRVQSCSSGFPGPESADNRPNICLVGNFYAAQSGQVGQCASPTWPTECLRKLRLRWTSVCNRVKGNRASDCQSHSCQRQRGVTAAQEESLAQTAYLCLQYICRIGTVHRITDRGDVRVQYSNNIRWTFHPGALTKVSSRQGKATYFARQRKCLVYQLLFFLFFFFLV